MIVKRTTLRDTINEMRRKKKKRYDILNRSISKPSSHMISDKDYRDLVSTFYGIYHCSR